MTSAANIEQIERAANLRFPLRVSHPNELLESLEKDGIHITDRWYRSAVDCGTLQCESAYKPGTCPNAEKLARTITNLPTHQGVASVEAKRLVGLVKSRSIVTERLG